MWVTVLQTGVDPPHCAFVRQATHVEVAVLQTGVAPAQAVALLAEHCPHAPDDSQAGVAPPHSLSPEQARQVWKAKSQTGDPPLQSASAVQRTQVPDGV